MAQNTFLRSNALLPKRIKHTSELLDGSSRLDRSDDWHEIPHRIHQAGPVRLRSRHGPQHGTMAERTIHTDRHHAPDMEC